MGVGILGGCRTDVDLVRRFVYTIAINTHHKQRCTLLLNPSWTNRVLSPRGERYVGRR